MWYKRTLNAHKVETRAIMRFGAYTQTVCEKCKAHLGDWILLRWRTDCNNAVIIYTKRFVQKCTYKCFLKFFINEKYCFYYYYLRLYLSI